jgi:hypothetical protein
VSEWKMNTEDAITQDHAGLKKTYRKSRLWYPLLFIVSSVVIATNAIVSGSEDMFFIIATELVISLLAWGHYSAATERDVLAVEFANASKHVDFLIEHPSNGNGSWQWDEISQENYIAWPDEDERTN